MPIPIRNVFNLRFGHIAQILLAGEFHIRQRKPLCIEPGLPQPCDSVIRHLSHLDLPRWSRQQSEAAPIHRHALLFVRRITTSGQLVVLACILTWRVG